MYKAAPAVQKYLQKEKGAAYIMKKTAVSVIAAVVLIACIFAGCKGADGGKITDNRQNLTEAMTDARDMLTEVSEMFTMAPETDINVSDPATDNVIM